MLLLTQKLLYIFKAKYLSTSVSSISKALKFPRLLGYFEIWGTLQVLALEDVGINVEDVFPGDAAISPEVQLGMKASLSALHARGFIHGDIARRNFCIERSRVVLVDFEFSEECT
jgi:tRNA A-37 threonylcarbamoyl transferase component Bud32